MDVLSNLEILDTSRWLGFVWFSRATKAHPSSHPAWGPCTWAKCTGSLRNSGKRTPPRRRRVEVAQEQLERRPVDQVRSTPAVGSLPNRPRPAVPAPAASTPLNSLTGSSKSQPAAFQSFHRRGRVAEHSGGAWTIGMRPLSCASIFETQRPKPACRRSGPIPEF
jgi:hypothetical protein